jgi:hypothetical protein
MNDLPRITVRGMVASGTASEAGKVLSSLFATRRGFGWGWSLRPELEFDRPGLRLSSFGPGLGDRNDWSLGGLGLEGRVCIRICNYACHCNLTFDLSYFLIYSLLQFGVQHKGRSFSGLRYSDKCGRSHNSVHCSDSDGSFSFVPLCSCAGRVGRGHQRTRTRYRQGTGVEVVCFAGVSGT